MRSGQPVLVTDNEDNKPSITMHNSKLTHLLALMDEVTYLKTQIEEEKRNLLTTIAEEKREEDRPYTKVINDILYRIDPSKPTGKQQTILIDGSTLPDVFGSGNLGRGDLASGALGSGNLGLVCSFCGQF